jgi:hypothetical protein
MWNYCGKKTHPRFHVAWNTYVTFLGFYIGFGNRMCKKVRRPEYSSTRKYYSGGILE